MSKHTYMREPMPQGRLSVCPLCLRGIEVNASGVMVRHGWKEQGRQKGQYGLGMQWGACIATGLRPLEQTDADGIKMIARLMKEKALWLKDAARHKKGDDFYPVSIDLTVSAWKEAATTEYQHEKPHNYLKAGLEFETRAYQEYPKYRYQGTNLVDYEERTFKIPRGFKGVQKNDWNGTKKFVVASYEKLRAGQEAHCRAQAEALQEAADAIKIAIEQHAKTEPDYKVTHKKTTVHLGCKPYRSYGGTVSTVCGSTSYSASKTEDRSEVTCSRCLKTIAKEDAEAAERAAEDALGERIVKHLGNLDSKQATVTELMKVLGVEKRKTANRALERLERAKKVHEVYGSTPAKWTLGDRGY